MTFIVLEIVILAYAFLKVYNSKLKPTIKAIDSALDQLQYFFPLKSTENSTENSFFEVSKDDSTGQKILEDPRPLPEENPVRNAKHKKFESNRVYQELLHHISAFVFTPAGAVGAAGVIEDTIERFIERSRDHVESGFPTMLYSGLFCTAFGICITLALLAVKLFISEEATADWDQSIIAITLGVSLTMYITCIVIFKLINKSKRFNDIDKQLDIEKEAFILALYVAFPGQGASTSQDALLQLGPQLHRFSDDINKFTKTITEKNDGIAEQVKMLQELQKIDFSAIAAAGDSLKGLNEKLNGVEDVYKSILNFGNQILPMIDKSKIDLSNTIKAMNAAFANMTNEQLSRLNELHNQILESFRKNVEKQNADLQSLNEAPTPFNNLGNLPKINNEVAKLTETAQEILELNKDLKKVLTPQYFDSDSDTSSFDAEDTFSKI